MVNSPFGLIDTHKTGPPCSAVTRSCNCDSDSPERRQTTLSPERHPATCPARRMNSGGGVSASFRCSSLIILDLMLIFTTFHFYGFCVARLLSRPRMHPPSGNRFPGLRAYKVDNNWLHVWDAGTFLSLKY